MKCVPMSANVNSGDVVEHSRESASATCTGHLIKRYMSVNIEFILKFRLESYGWPFALGPPFILIYVHCETF